MANEKQTTARVNMNRLAPILFGLPWLEIFAEIVKVARQLWQGLADEGLYEVLEHEATLELQDVKGKKAKVRKRQKVRYRQNNIIAYQDQAWGDGEILVNYRCTPGVEVDRYRAAHKTNLLISLRETKRRGDLDEFNIEWLFKNGFLRPREYWATEVSHRTKWLKIQVLFPKARPPHRTWLVERLRRRTHRLGQGAKVRLPGGQWAVYWETHRPRINERYVLNWEW